MQRNQLSSSALPDRPGGRPVRPVRRINRPRETSVGARARPPTSSLGGALELVGTRASQRRHASEIGGNLRGIYAKLCEI